MSELLHRTTIFESTLDEEDSHFYLSVIQQQKWFKYSSTDISINDVCSAIDTFVLLHASISYPEKDISKFWTPIPYIVFRYVMDDLGSWHHVSEFKPFDGYTVQGAAWSNGFYYIVSNKDFLIEANLFVDIHTKEQYNYQ
jgi:hypothetical protein